MLPSNFAEENRGLTEINLSITCSILAGRNKSFSHFPKLQKPQGHWINDYTLVENYAAPCLNVLRFQINPFIPNSA